jgi:hypothetical protein
MIALLLANRGLAEIVGVMLLLIGGYAAWVHHDHFEQGLGEAACEQKVTETKAQAESAQEQKDKDYAEQTHNAQVQHDAELAGLHPVTTPLIVYRNSPALCSNPVPNPAAAPSSTSARGAVVGGSGVDLRPAVDAFERKYETALADCREALKSWPTSSSD